MPVETSNRYFYIYKPAKVLSQFVTEDRHQKNKRFLGELFDFPIGSMSVGRLDERSEGLLLITTDGKFSHHITSSGIEKEYYSLVDGKPTYEQINSLQQKLKISVNGKKKTVQALEAKILENPPQLPQPGFHIRDDRHGPSTWISITIDRGYFRQVRKMTAQVGLPTLRLIRARIGNLKLEEFNKGSVNDIPVSELPQLFGYAIDHQY